MSDQETGLPTTWALVRLDELVSNPGADIVDGPFGSDLKASEYIETGVPIIRLQNVSAGEFIEKNIRYVSDAKAESLRRHSYVPGDLVITKLGSPLGEVCIVPAHFPPGIIVADIVRLRPHALVNRQALMYALNSEQPQRQLKDLTKGTTRPRVNLHHIRAITVPVPPRQEQTRLVAELEKQFTRLDAATRALKRVQANLTRYRASVLKAACEGRLVPTEAELAHKEGRDYEPADKLLQRILRERRARWEADTLAKMLASGKPPKDDRWTQKYKEPLAPDTTNLPPLPEGWICVSLDTIADVIDPNPSHRTPRYVDDGVAFVSAENFVGDSGVNFRIGRQVGQEVLKEQIARFSILPGAFAMSRYGTIGKTCKLPPERTYCLSYSLVVIQSTSVQIDNDFLCLVCSSGMIMALAKSRVQGAAIPDLGVAHIRSLPIAIPGRSEQIRINSEAARKLSVVDQLIEDVSCQMLHADRLRQSVLGSAFAGQLVPQEPTEEPAYVLLDRIRRERKDAKNRREG